MDKDIEIEGLDEIDSNEDWEDDEATYNSKSEYKKPILAMEAVKACREARAKEMTKGFWNNKFDKNGNSVHVWVSDERKIYINSVIALQKFLATECLNDKKFKDFKKEFDKKIEKIFDRYAYSSFEYDSNTSGWKKTDVKFIPQIDEELLVPSLQDPNVLTNQKGGWNHKVNAYYDELVPIYDELFEELNKVISRLDDFSQKFA